MLIENRQYLTNVYAIIDNSLKIARYIYVQMVVYMELINMNPSLLF